MLRLKQLFSAALIFSSIYASSYAGQVDLIYNLSGADAADSQAAWHGARVARCVINESGNDIELILYNGQSIPKLNAAIGKMRAASDASTIVIGLGNAEEIIAAAKPVLAANKVFITTTEIDSGNLGENFFTVTSSYSAEGDLAATHFENLYQKHFHSKPTAAAYKGYNAVMTAATALKSGASPSPAQLALSVREITSHNQKSYYPMLMANRAKLKNLQ